MNLKVTTLREMIELLGDADASIGHSPLNGPIYIDRTKQPSHCDSCNHTSNWFEGCSRSICPMRRMVTAQLRMRR